MIDIYAEFEAHENYISRLKKLPIELAIADINVLLDEIIAYHKLDANEIYNIFSDGGKTINKNLGGADYAKE